MSAVWLEIVLPGVWSLLCAGAAGHFWQRARIEKARVRRTMELQLTMGPYELVRVSAEDLYLQYRYGSYSAEMLDGGWSEIQAVPLATGELFRVCTRPVEPAERHPREHP